MANIIQRITLQGAEEIRAQLRALGTAGKDAFDKLSDTKAMNDRLSAAGINVKQIGDHLKSFGGAAQKASVDGQAFGNAVHSSFLRLTATAAGLGLAFGKVIEKFKSVGAEAEELQQNADAAGLAVPQYEALTNALGQNGVGSAEAAKGLDKVAKFIVAAKDESDDYEKKLKKLNEENRKGTLTYKEYSEKLKDLNDGMGKSAQIVQRYKLKLTDASGELVNVRDFAIQFGEALGKSDSAARKAADGLAVFGKSGRKLTQAFGQGQEAISVLEKRAQALAPSLTESAQQAVTGMDDAFDQLGQTGKSLTRELVSIFAPSVTAGVTAFTEAIARNRFMFTDLAETIDRQFRPVLFAVMEQLGSTDFSLTLQNAFTKIGEGIKATATAIRTIIIPAFVALYTFAGQVAAAINKIFGTDLTAGGVIAAAVLLKVTGLFSVFTTGVTFAVSATGLLIKALPLLADGFKILTAVLRANPIIALGIAIGILVGLILRQFPQIGVAIKQFFEDPLGNIKKAWDQLAIWFGTFFQNLLIIFATIGLQLAAPFVSAALFIASKWEAIKTGATTAVDYIKTKWGELTQFFTDLYNGVAKFIADKWQAIQDGAVNLYNTIKDGALAPFNAIKNAASSMYNSVAGWFDSLIQKAKDFLGLNAKAKAEGSGDGGGTPAQSNAAGGFIRGKGTGTSDSILSWLSNGEFVIKAKAVQHYGPQLLAAINGMRLPKFSGGGLSAGLSGMARAALTPSIPRFAAGGLALAPAGGGGGGRPMILQIGDTQIGGLRADAGAVDAIQRFAAQSAVRSGGRKPTWFKG